MQQTFHIENGQKIEIFTNDTPKAMKQLKVELEKKGRQVTIWVNNGFKDIWMMTSRWPF
jgi:hypothetical protein